MTSSGNGLLMLLIPEGSTENYKNTLTIRTADVVRSWRQGSNTALTEAVFSTKGDTIPSWKGMSEKQKKGENHFHICKIHNPAFKKCFQN